MGRSKSVPLGLRCSARMMLLYLSSGFIEYLSRFLDGGVDFSGNIALETADDVTLTHSLSGSASHVCLGPEVMAESDHNDAIESRIGLTVPTSVEPMAVGLAGGSRYGTYTAQRGERGVGLEAFGVTAGSDQEIGRRAGSYAEDTDQGWSGRPGESIELGLEVVDLLAELMVAAGKRAKCVPGRCHRTVQTTCTEALTACDQGRRR